MSQHDPGEITRLLDAAAGGDPLAREQVWQAVYDELRKLAEAHLAHDGQRREVHPTTLVHEVYCRLFGSAPLELRSRGHFYTLCAAAMRRYCVDRARSDKRLKRGGGRRPLPLTEEPCEAGRDPVEELAIDEALTRLESQDPRLAHVVKLRYYAGLTVDETAAVLNVSPRTVDNAWRFARTWLYRELVTGTKA